MDYSNLNPNHSVSTLREVLSEADSETTDRLQQRSGAVLDDANITVVDVATLNRDDITILCDLAENGDY